MITCKCGETFAPDESIGSVYSLCQDCWEKHCAQRWHDFTDQYLQSSTKRNPMNPIKAALVRVRMQWTLDPQPGSTWRRTVIYTAHVITPRGVAWAVSEAHRLYGHHADFKIRGVVVECDGADTDVILDPEVQQ